MDVIRPRLASRIAISRHDSIVISARRLSSAAAAAAQVDTPAGLSSNDHRPQQTATAAPHHSIRLLRV